MLKRKLAKMIFLVGPVQVNWVQRTHRTYFHIKKNHVVVFSTKCEVYILKMNVKNTVSANANRMWEDVQSDYRKEKLVPNVDALRRPVQLWKAQLFNDRKVEFDHFNPSISKYCFDAVDHKLSHTWNSCDTLSTLTNFFVVYKMCRFVIFTFAYAAIQTDQNISPLLSNQAFI